MRRLIQRVPQNVAEDLWVLLERAFVPHASDSPRRAVAGRRLPPGFQAVAPLFAVAYRSTPEDLAGRRCEPWRAAQAPAQAALGRVDPVLTRFGHPWGPIGSVAFELATGLPATTAACDLDLVLRREE